jgi:hypothetical protein
MLVEPPKGIEPLTFSLRVRAIATTSVHEHPLISRSSRSCPGSSGGFAARCCQAAPLRTTAEPLKIDLPPQSVGQRDQTSSRKADDRGVVNVHLAIKASCKYPAGRSWSTMTRTGGSHLDLSLLEPPPRRLSENRSSRSSAGS